MRIAAMLLASLLATSATQAETIYVLPNSATPWSSKTPFKQVTIGNENLLEVKPVTDRTMIILAKDPEYLAVENGNLLVFDDQNNLIENLQVIVSPFGRPHITMRQGRVEYYCSMRCIPAVKPDKKGIGDADSLSITRTWNR